MAWFADGHSPRIARVRIGQQLSGATLPVACQSTWKQAILPREPLRSLAPLLRTRIVDYLCAKSPTTPCPHCYTSNTWHFLVRKEVRGDIYRNSVHFDSRPRFLIRVSTRILCYHTRVITRVTQGSEGTMAKTQPGGKNRSRPGRANSDAQPKRRARGLKRQQEILAAAEQVFAELGYQDANTNLIAEQANCSPGTLYQFFKNKEEIAETIANGYAGELQAIQQAITEPSRYKTIEEAVDEVIDGNLKFLRTAPAFGVLLHATHLDSPARGTGPLLAHTIAERIAAILKRHGPALSDADTYFHAEVCVRVFGGMLPLLQHADPRIRRRAAHELKELTKRYLGPIVYGR